MCVFKKRCVSFLSGDGGEKPDAGGPADWSGAASGEQPAGAGSLSQKPALPAGAAGQQNLWAERAAGCTGQAAGGQLDGERRRLCHHLQPPPPTQQPAPRLLPHVGTHLLTDNLNSLFFVFFLPHACKGLHTTLYFNTHPRSDRLQTAMWSLPLRSTLDKSTEAFLALRKH